MTMAGHDVVVLILRGGETPHHILRLPSPHYSTINVLAEMQKQEDALKRTLFLYHFTVHPSSILRLLHTVFPIFPRPATATCDPSTSLMITLYCLCVFVFHFYLLAHFFVVIFQPVLSRVTPSRFCH